MSVGPSLLGHLQRIPKDSDIASWDIILISEQFWKHLASQGINASLERFPMQLPICACFSSTCMLLFVASLTSTSSGDVAPLMEKALTRWAQAELSGQARLGLFCSGLSARYGKFLSCNWSTIVYLLVLGTSPLPVTPDYAGSTVRYADGVFDPHFGRYVTVMEGE